MRLLFILLTCSQVVIAQKQYTLEMLIQRAIEIHPAIKGADAEQKQILALKRTSIELPKTEVTLTYGQYNSIVNNDNNITISQTLPFPTVWTSQRALYKERVVASQLKSEVTTNEITYQVKQLHQLWLYQSSQHELMTRQDSLYAWLLKAVVTRYNLGDGTLLEKTAIETQRYEIQNSLIQSAAAKENTNVQLQLLLQHNEPLAIAGNFVALPIPETVNASLEQNPALQYRKRQSVVAMHQKKLEVNRVLPDITIGYFNQTLIGFQTVDGQERYFDNDKRFDGFIVGVAIPLWLNSHTGKVKAAEYNRMATEYEEQAFRISLQQEQARALQELNKNKNTLAYYDSSALPSATLLEQQSSTAFKNGEIDYATFLLNLRQALSIRQNYLQALHDFNQSIIRLEYLNGSSK